MAITVKPIGSKLYVQILEKQATTKSGLVVVTKKQKFEEDTLNAYIVASGPETSPELQAGTVVIISGSAGRWVDPELTSDPESVFRVIDEDEVIACVEETQDA